MATEITDGAVIYAGYVYRQRIVTEGALFPAGAALTAHVRRAVSAQSILATLTVGAGITRISDTEIEVEIPGAATSALVGGSVFVDFVRTDVNPDQHLQFILEIPVHLPVTRGLA